MLAVTILFTLLQCLLTQAQVDIHEKHEGYTIEKSDPNAGGGILFLCRVRQRLEKPKHRYKE